MPKLARLAFGILLLAAPVGLQAQTAAPQPGEIPPDALVPNAEIAAVFQALALHPLTDDVLATTFQNAPGGSAAPLDDIIEPMFVRGEQVSNWDATGLDLNSILASRPGGTGGNMLRGESQAGHIYAYVQDRPIEAFIPQGWLLVARRGTPVTGAGVSVEIGRLSPKVILAERVSYERHGHADCRAHAESRVYADPDVPATELDGIAVIMTMRQLARIERSRICSVTEEVSPNHYRARLFDREGYRLPGLERESPVWEIVPLAPVPAR